ncbi:MAG: uracil-DNA glycosylase family protein, partial [Pseudomonadota bacterium]
MSAQAEELHAEIKACTLCAEHLPLGPRPVVQFSPSSRILIIGQAPGTKVHASGIPWDDDSGDRLRGWLGLDKPAFYDPDAIALMPMGFCYPGKAKG